MGPGCAVFSAEGDSRLSCWWFAFRIPAFAAVLVIVWLMIARAPPGLH
ncbi:hypothetical protein [Methyloceanibacter sp. wino2]|nr:hypothetical protein [Methyloceanibacter sp. wino2]